MRSVATAGRRGRSLVSFWVTEPVEFSIAGPPGNWWHGRYQGGIHYGGGGGGSGTQDERDISRVSPVKGWGWSCRKSSIVLVRVKCLRAVCRFALVRLIAETTPADASLACKEAERTQNRKLYTALVAAVERTQARPAKSAGGSAKRRQCENDGFVELDRRVRQEGLPEIVGRWWLASYHYRARFLVLCPCLQSGGGFLLGSTATCR